MFSPGAKFVRSPCGNHGIKNHIAQPLRFLLVVTILSIGLTAGATEERGIKRIIVSDEQGNTDAVELYGESHALVIGVSDYTAGWPDLESIPLELATVTEALESHGFHVETHLDPDAEQLWKIFQDFINLYGYTINNRLLFYFAGHGYTWKGHHGYLVPADAPRPLSDNGYPGADFLRKALDMSQILAWTRQITAKHALFLFDSCFSGTIFKTRALPKSPRHISRATGLPVRQFITAGSAGEEVPAKSIFSPVFAHALKYGWGDINNDGYITGTELGVYLQSTVPEHARQNPQFGKHPDYELTLGDFVFILNETETFPAERKERTQPPLIRQYKDKPPSAVDPGDKPKGKSDKKPKVFGNF